MLPERFQTQFITPVEFVGLILALDRTAVQYLLFKDPDAACPCPGGPRACTGLEEFLAWLTDKDRMETSALALSSIA